MGSDSQTLVRATDPGLQKRLEAEGYEAGRWQGEWVVLRDPRADAKALSRRYGTAVEWDISTVVDSVVIVAFQDGRVVRSLEYSAETGGWGKVTGRPLDFEDGPKLKKWLRRRNILASPDGYDVLDAFLGASGGNSQRARAFARALGNTDPLAQALAVALGELKQKVDHEKPYGLSLRLEKPRLGLRLNTEEAHTRAVLRRAKREPFFKQSALARRSAVRWTPEEWEYTASMPIDTESEDLQGRLTRLLKSDLVEQTLGAGVVCLVDRWPVERFSPKQARQLGIGLTERDELELEREALLEATGATCVDLWLRRYEEPGTWFSGRFGDSVHEHIQTNVELFAPDLLRALKREPKAAAGLADFFRERNALPLAKNRAVVRGLQEHLSKTRSPQTASALCNLGFPVPKIDAKGKLLNLDDFVARPRK